MAVYKIELQTLLPTVPPYYQFVSDGKSSWLPNRVCTGHLYTMYTANSSKVVPEGQNLKLQKL